MQNKGCKIRRYTCSNGAVICSNCVVFSLVYVGFPCSITQPTVILVEFHLYGYLEDGYCSYSASSSTINNTSPTVTYHDLSQTVMHIYEKLRWQTDGELRKNYTDPISAPSTGAENLNNTSTRGD